MSNLDHCDLLNVLAPLSVDLRDSREGMTAVHYAAKYGRRAVGQADQGEGAQFRWALMGVVPYHPSVERFLDALEAIVVLNRHSVSRLWRRGLSQRQGL